MWHHPKKPEYREMFSNMATDNSFIEVICRCIYENDDILVIHSVMRFQDGAQEPVIAVNMLENGQVILAKSNA